MLLNPLKGGLKLCGVAIAKGGGRASGRECTGCKRQKFEFAQTCQILASHKALLLSVLRRSEPKAQIVPPPDGPAAGEMIGFSGFRLDTAGAKLFDENDAEITLTAMEFRLLRVFVENRGRVLNRDQLLELAHDRGWDPFDRSIDIRISRLRRKIEINPSKPSMIRTVRGIGYLFDPEGG